MGTMYSQVCLMSLTMQTHHQHGLQLAFIYANQICAFSYLTYSTWEVAYQIYLIDLVYGISDIRFYNLRHFSNL